jgi:hypothetical protein
MFALLQSPDIPLQQSISESLAGWLGLKQAS